MILQKNPFIISLNTDLLTITRAAHGHLLGTNKTIETITTDSRCAEPSSLFVAIEGKNFDGHKYCNNAIELGSIAILTEKIIQTNSRISIILVKSTKQALLRLGAWKRNLCKETKVIAITGSAGKTTTKELITSILKEKVGKDKILSTYTNWNNYMGVPLMLLKMQKKHRYAVIEIGANHEGEIKTLSEIVNSDMAIITNIRKVHLSGFGTLQKIFHAKTEIIDGLKKNGVLIINNEDKFAPLIKNKLINKKNSKRNLSYFAYGKNSSSNIYAENIYQNIDAETINFQACTSTYSVNIKLNMLGLHNVENALAAISACYLLGIDKNTISKGLYANKPADKRMNIVNGKFGSKIINDTYNSNPESMQCAINLLKAMKTSSCALILVMGDNLELGNESIQLHKDIGKYAKSNDIDILLAYGEHSEFAVKEFGSNAEHYKEKSALINKLLKLMQTKKSIILVKGSRSMKMEEIVTAVI